MTQYPPRAVAALADLDRLVAVHPELRGEAARLAAFVDVAAVAGVDAVAAVDVTDLDQEHELAAVTPANDTREKGG